MEIFQILADSLGQEGIPFVLIGSFALQHHGIARLTADVDLLIDERDADRAAGILERRGFVLSTRSDVFARWRHPDASMMDVDLLFVSRSTLKAVLESAEETTFSDRRFLVPSAETLIAMKLHAIRHNPGRFSRDGLDIAALARGEDLPLDHLQALCARYASPDIFERLKVLLHGLETDR